MAVHTCVISVCCCYTDYKYREVCSLSLEEADRLIAMKLCGDLHRSNPSMFSSIGIYSSIFLAHFKKYILIYDLEN